MNYTEKYHLPQWEEDDRVMRTDFNQMCANIESGIDGAKAQAAQSDAALDRKIAAAQAAAEELPYVVGTYCGTGQLQKIVLGFRPAAVLICKIYSSNIENAKDVVALFTGTGRNKVLTIDEDGFLLLSQYTQPQVNSNTTDYCYMAFR